MIRRPWGLWTPGAMAAAGTGDQDSGQYWDRVATDWQREEFLDGWRGHADAVNLALCARWWPPRQVGRVLKTDLFDEVAGRGLLPTLRTQAGSTFAIDRSFQASRAGSRRTGASVVNADVRGLPFAGGVFDLVVSNSTLDHFDDVAQIERAVIEIHRVLAPGGRFILTLDNPANPVVALRNALPFALLHHVGLVPYYVGATLAAPEAQQMLQAAGFRVKETTAVLHCPRAPAIAVLGLIRWIGSVGIRRRLQSWLMAFERLERAATRQRTGYFVALVADKEGA
jgi:SAM-dependent methyltransferase